MKPVDQTTFGHPGGNCFSACVASILGLPISEVPYFMGEPGEPGGKWAGRLSEFLRPRGYYALHFNIDPERLDREVLWPEGYFIRCGKSARGDHAVVAKGAEVVHDPHPSRAGLLSTDAMCVICSLDLEPNFVRRA